MKIGCITKNTEAINALYTTLFADMGYEIEIIDINNNLQNYDPSQYDLTVVTSIDNNEAVNLLTRCYNEKHKFIFGTYSIGGVTALPFITYSDTNNSSININGNAANGLFANTTKSMNTGSSYASAITIKNESDNYISLSNNGGASLVGIANNYCFIGFLPWEDTVRLTTDGKEYITIVLLKFLRDKFVSYYIEGSIKDKNGNPLIREIRAYKQLDGLFAGKTLSDYLGKYSLELYTNDPVMVVCIGDRNTNTQNSIVYDNIVPLEKIIS